MAINPFFNANLYLARNPDLVAAGLHTPEQLWNHYVNFGAQESVIFDERAPNDWFDVDYYLGNYPDLVNAGITAGQALDHFFNYGILEGRAFNATIRADQFDAETYAEKNPDVREALGIAEGAELTAENKAELLKHYLSYGYAEGREGAGEISKEVIQQNEIPIYWTVGDGEAVTGTIANDEFIVVDWASFGKNAVIDGLAGNDTVIFERNVIAGDDDLSDALTLRSIENVEVVGVEVDAKVASQLDSLTLSSAKDEDGKPISNANATLLFAEALVAGSADVLNVAVGQQVLPAEGDSLLQGGLDAEDVRCPDDSTILSVNGFETVNVALDAKFEGGIVIASSETQGAEQTVTLTGAKKDAKVGILFENVGSPDLTNLTIDASGLAAQLAEVDLGDQVANVANITIKGSKTAENDLDLSEEGFKISQTVTVVGGDEADTFTATKAIDVFTGGKGDDIFTFTAATSVVKMTSGEKPTISAVDTITDFKAGDKVDLGVAFDDVNFVEAQTGQGATLNSLDAWVKHVTTEGVAVEGELAAFNFGGDAYLVLAAANEDADASVIKLAGVNAGKLEVDGDFIVLA